MNKPVTVIRNLRVVYNDADRLVLGRQLADTHKDLEQAQADKRSVVSDFAARIKSHEAKIIDLAGKVSNGYQVKEVTCEWRFHQPKDNMKQLVRLDTGESVEVADMLHSELQPELPLADPNQEHLKDIGDGVIAEKLDDAVERKKLASDPESGVVKVEADEDDES